MNSHCRDFGLRQFADLLSEKGVIVGERQVYNWIGSGKISCVSGDVELALEHYDEWKPGGHHRWGKSEPPPGWITVSRARSELHLSQGGLYGYFDAGILESRLVNGRRYISETSLAQLSEAQPSAKGYVVYHGSHY